MGSLVKALERFNRKERNLLVRAATGNHELPLQLSSVFRGRIADALGLAEEIPASAWWAADYHIAWLAGALSVYVLGDDALEKKWPNPKIGTRQLIEPNQEDIDLVVSWENHIVLLEAKGYGYFSNSQLRSKLERLNLLQKYYEALIGNSSADVDFRLLLISPRAPEKVNVPAPSWLCSTDKIPWMELDLGDAGDQLLVSRCNMNGDIGASGDHWRLVPQNT